MLIVVVATAGQVPADLVLTIGNGEINTGAEPRNPITVAQGQSGSIRFSAGAVGEAFSLDGYNIYIDIGPVGTGMDGFGLPTGITFTGATPVAGGFNSDGMVNLDVTNAAFADLVTGGNGNYDFIVDDSRSGGLALADGQTTALLDLNFDVALTATAGVYDVLFVASPILVGPGTQFQTTPNDRTLQAFSGSIEVTAVPEPSSIAAFALLSAGIVARNNRKRKRSTTKSS